MALLRHPRFPVTEISRRSTLLAHNAGIWEGWFVRCDGQGRELDRFASRLQVEDRAGRVEAELTNRSSGSVRSMRFAEPPPEMQITAEGHWSLGPDRIGAWPWVCELCLTAGERRRRVVVRHGSDGLESLVLVWEARAGVEDPAPAAPLILAGQPLAAAPGGSRHLWRADAELEVETMTGPRGAGAEQVVLRWRPAGCPEQTIRRAYGSFGVLLPLE